MVYSAERLVVCLSVCHFVLVFFGPFGVAVASLYLFIYLFIYFFLGGGVVVGGAGLGAFRTFVRFVLVWICRFPLPLGVWEGLRFVIVALLGLFSYLFLIKLKDLTKQIFSVNIRHTFFGFFFFFFFFFFFLLLFRRNPLNQTFLT